MNLPPLPKPDVAACTIYQYTADQMREYGEACRKRALEEAAQLCMELDNAENSEMYAAAARFCAERIRSMK